MISLPCFLLLQIVAICLHGATSTEGIDREQQHKLKHHENHASSYNDLFKTIDQNSNGNVSPEEIQQFIVKTGGSSLDDDTEIADAVVNVLGSLGNNRDNSLGVDDISRFWMSQASTLTVEDVCDWVVHSLHMPEEIVDIMRANAVTGYDFPDLVKHDGRLIETELGITKRTLKSRLYRGVVMRLMGMGTMPFEVLTVTADGVSCNEIRLEWTVQKGERHGFPTHKYLVQRYVSGFASGAEISPNDSAFADESIVVNPLQMDGGSGSQTPFTALGHVGLPEWVAVCSDMATFCIDKGLEHGMKYKYRISAWNAIGRSEYFYVQVDTKSNCTKRLDMQSNTSTIMKSSLSRISTVATLMYSYLLSLIYWGFYSLFALIVGCILLETVYRLIVSCELLQKTQFGDSVRVDSNTANAKTIHLFGISIPLSEEGVRFVTIVRAWMVENVFEFGILLLPKTFLKTLDTIAVATHKDPRNPTGELKSPLKLSPTRARQRATSAYNASAVAISINGLGPLDFKRCYMCNKKFSYMTRSKHYCGKCNHNFCRRCAGHIDHVWPTPCKVNSRCLCNKCLLLAKPEHD